ncbi:MAG: hypothetical protein GX030_09705 [Firmicutes bacterium]|nr:hypothetical protein [Bacillota bacterium]
MEFSPKDVIVAVVTTNPELVSGGAPIFHARDEEELERITLYLSRITFGMDHDLGNGVHVIVKH